MKSQLTLLVALLFISILLAPQKSIMIITTEGNSYDISKEIPVTFLGPIFSDTKFIKFGLPDLKTYKNRDTKAISVWSKIGSEKLAYDIWLKYYFLPYILIGLVIFRMNRRKKVG